MQYSGSREPYWAAPRAPRESSVEAQTLGVDVVEEYKSQAGRPAAERAAHVARKLGGAAYAAADKGAAHLATHALTRLGVKGAHLKALPGKGAKV